MSKIIPLLIVVTVFGVLIHESQSTPSVGQAAPAFTLKDSNGKSHSLSDFAGKYVILEWINHDCPFVKKFYESGKMQELQSAEVAAGAVWLSICSSAPGKQGHLSPDAWNAKTAEVGSAASAVLLDEDGSVGNLYAAKTTPHMFVISPEGMLIYAGAIDSVKSTKSDDIAKATNYVAQALKEARAGQPVSVPTTPPYGCSVKY